MITHLFNIVHAAQTPASGQGPEDLHLTALAFGEALVQAALACGTHLRVALVQ